VQIPKVVDDTFAPWDAVEPLLRRSEDTARSERERTLGARRAMLPAKSTPQDAIERQLEQLKAADPVEAKGRLTVFSLKGNRDVQSMVESAFRKFLPYNALFAPYLPSVGIMERDVIDMSVTMLGGSESAAGDLTVGGSESIYCGLHAAREWARQMKPEILEPQIIAPWSAHPAFSKGAHLLGMKLVRIDVGPDHRADLGALEAAITSNTIGLVGSAPCWPYGLYDDIPALGQLALERKLWLHVDACVGGFLAPFVARTGRTIPPFDLSVPGVRSLSADLHKYGYAAKPLSLILWADRALQQYHHQVVISWPSGPYMSQSLVGSRPAGAVASAWAVMNMLGVEGYVRLADRTMTVKERLAAGIRALQVFDVWDNELSLLVFGSKQLDVRHVTAALKAKGWFMMGTMHPPLIHFTVDAVEDEIVDALLADLADTTSAVRSGLANELADLSYT
jgi:sphinganine-1-phosphate aldolase